MQAVHINFIEDRRWHWVWGAALLCAMLIATLLLWKHQLTQTAVRDTQAQTQQIHTQSQALRQLQSRADPQQASAQKAVELLQQDLNPLFTTVERIKEVGVRLRRLDLDAGTGTAGLEFELDSALKVNTLGALLNAGYDNRPWQLGAVTLPGSTTPPGLPATTMVRAAWSAPLNKL